MSKFEITRGKGFQLTFSNGYMVSVQFGPGNYCQNWYGQDASLPSQDAEVAVFDPDGEYVHVPGFGFNCDDVVGWNDADEVARLIATVSGVLGSQS